MEQYLHRAAAVHQLINAGNALEKACSAAVAAKDEPLFALIHKQHMEIWNLVIRVMKGEDLRNHHGPTAEDLGLSEAHRGADPL